MKSTISHRSLRQSLTAWPLVPASVALLVSAVLCFWTFSEAQEASASTIRAQENLATAQRSAGMLRRLVPQHMSEGGSQTLVQKLEQDLKNGGADPRCISSVAFQSLGTLTGVPSSRQQARIELTGLKLKQVALALDSVESSGLPCWIDSVELNASGASGEASDTWTAILQVQWLAASMAGN